VPVRSELDQEEVRARLARWLSAKLGYEVSLTALPGPAFSGFSNETLLFDATWDARKLGMAVRLEPSGHQVFPDAAFSTQVRVIRSLERTGVRAPRILWDEPHPDPSVLGGAFFVMERVDGRAPPDNPPYHVAGWLHEVSPEIRARIWWNGLEQMAAVHRLEPFDFLPPRTAKEQLVLDREYAAWVLGDREYPIVAQTMDELERTMPTTEAPAAQCWGDSRIGNILYDDAGEALAVLDWEMVHVGNPLGDLAWFLLLDRHHSESCDAPRLDGFPSHEDTVARWAELTGRDTNDLRWWLTLGAARYAVILTRVMDLLEDTGLLPGARGMAFDNTSTKLLRSILADGGVGA
jgi:aminoglycoside phosphotransferase (APT) family kinase protein